MIGEEALKNFEAAAKLVRERKFNEALLVPLLPSDRAVIEKRIAAMNPSQF